MSTLQYSVIRKDNISIITIGGSLDAKTSPGFGSKLEREVKKTDYIIINMEKLDYISSAGFGVLININEILKKRKGELRLCLLNGKIKKIFKLLGFSHLFRIYDSVDDAADV